MIYGDLVSPCIQLHADSYSDTDSIFFLVLIGVFLNGAERTLNSVNSANSWNLVYHSTFSRVHKVGNNGINTNFVFPCIYSFLHYFLSSDVSKFANRGQLVKRITF